MDNGSLEDHFPLQTFFFTSVLVPESVKYLDPGESTNKPGPVYQPTSHLTWNHLFIIMTKEGFNSITG